MATMGCSLMCNEAVIVKRERERERDKQKRMKRKRKNGGLICFLLLLAVVVVVLYTHNIVTKGLRVGGKRYDGDCVVASIK